MIYLDNNATSALDNKVLEQMLPWLRHQYGNPASNHAQGWIAQKKVDEVRIQITETLHAHHKDEVVFTSGATESINLALRGFYHNYSPLSHALAYSPTEHKAVIDTVKDLEKNGLSIHKIRVDSNGLVQLDSLEQLLMKGIKMVCVMHANNETGVLQPIDEIGQLTRKYGAVFLCDITQTIGKKILNVENSNIDLACASIHKCHGPAGLGILIVNRKKPRIELHPLITGGGHENGLRSGTLNVAGIVGLGAAVQLAYSELDKTESYIQVLKHQLKLLLLSSGQFETTIANDVPQLHTTLHLKSTIEAKKLITKLAAKLCFSSGSACSSALSEPSHVLKAMGMSTTDARKCIRLSLSKFTTADEVNQAAQWLVKAIV